MKLPKLAERIYQKLVPPQREPDFVIGDHYMDRWWVIPRNKIFNIYLHHIRHSDDDRALHDHPWWSLSLCLAGFMVEYYKKGEYINRRGVWQGDVVFRNGSFAHRLEIPEDGKGAWTLFITGPVFRTWGFHCPQGWRPWQEFVAPGNKGKRGRGCD